ncbi:MAG: bifunctional folylpolyglutamate synthase/dihydrofolate synthase [Verrucomicrobiota bacterium]|nr:bifunctional folylpolyglutamate synthase/dihydrofolate synthase [Verrucomicrobiota bacterium]
MNYREALAWLFGTQLFGIKLGLENIQHLLGKLALPGAEQRIIHVAGTNGKGSVCAMIDAILRAAGYRSGLFTSPHLVTFRERVQVDGELISEAEVAAGLTSIRTLVADSDPHPTFFEIATALGLLHFKQRACQFVLLETGMGGRLDATNAVTPVVSVITPIDYDHQQWLGHSLGEIAAEKAGIIKPRVPVVSAPQAPEAAAVIRARASACEAPIEFVENSYYASPIALRGRHQAANAALALAALCASGVNVPEEAIVEGLARVAWPARFQVWNDRIVIDGAHNPAGARVLAETWRESFGDEEAALVLGVMQDKNARAIYGALASISGAIFLPRFRGERAMPPQELAEIISAAHPATKIVIADSCGEALQLASERSQRVLVTGSLHLAGEVLAHLQGRPAAFEECAQ